MREISGRSFWIGAAAGAIVAGVLALGLVGAIDRGGIAAGAAPAVISATAPAGTATMAAAPVAATGAASSAASSAVSSAVASQLQAAQDRIKALEDPGRPVVTLADGTQFTAQQAAERIAQLQGLDVFAPYLGCASLLSSSSIDAAVACMKSVAPYASP